MRLLLTKKIAGSLRTYITSLVLTEVWDMTHAWATHVSDMDSRVGKPREKNENLDKNNPILLVCRKFVFPNLFDFGLFLSILPIEKTRTETGNGDASSFRVRQIKTS
jgi:hypothetical protein